VGGQEKISRFFGFIVVGGTVAILDLGLVWPVGHVLPTVKAVSLAYFTAVGCLLPLTNSGLLV
jgi:hypothetical protein